MLEDETKADADSLAKKNSNSDLAALDDEPGAFTVSNLKRVSATDTTKEIDGKDGLDDLADATRTGASKALKDSSKTDK